MSLVKGIHHVTVCVSGAQEDIDFQTKVLGQRMIKQTILFDGRYAHYHLYFSNADCDPGSVYTTFPYKRIHGRPGTGQLQATSYSVPKGSIKFWVEHLNRHDITHTGIQERFGQSFIRLNHPSGIQVEVLEDDNDHRNGWTTDQISSDVTTRGFHDAVVSVREVAETERFFVDALGFRKTGQDGAYHRFEVGIGGPAKTVILQHEPDRPAGSWTFGSGTAHHLALQIDSDEELAQQKGIYDELGYTDCSEIKDRQYFHSVYCRAPGGILIECAASVPLSFAVDEPSDQLGTHLLLPPWFEARREEIQKMLEPIQVPEGNIPKEMPKVVAPPPTVSPDSTAEQAPGGILTPSRRTAAIFVGGDAETDK